MEERIGLHCLALIIKGTPKSKHLHINRYSPAVFITIAPTKSNGLLYKKLSQ